MKEIKAIIQPFMLSKVAWALQQIPGFPGMTVTKTQGFGRGKAKGAPHAIVEDLITYVPKVKIELVVNDDIVEEVVRTILKSAHTGNKGDGKIFINEVLNAVRIRTGEVNEAAV
ncbi:MAG TPA: P-II family nitrogen regulator [Syntrophorhabdaceae bacterium]|jgi:nitrogen regulatory protein P-II 1